MIAKLSAFGRKIYSNNFGLALALTVCFILITLFLGYYSNLVIPGNADPSARYLAEPGTHLDFMSEWDGPHYLHIAKYGYTEHEGLTAFFPLYPLLIRLVMFALSSPLISALVVSWICLVGAVYFYIRILKDLFKYAHQTAILGVLLFLFFPTGVFLAATYTESLFAFLALGAIFYGWRSKYLYAGVLAGLATAAHPTGVLLIPLIAILLWEAKAKIRQIIAAFLLSCSGIVGYTCYLWVSIGKPLAFISSQRHNHWLSSHFFTQIVNTATAIDIGLIVLAAISTFYWWSRKKSLALYSLLFVLLPLVGGNFGGYSRYVLMAFPIQFMFLEKFAKSRLGYPVVLLISGVAWAYFVIHYAAGYTGGS